MRQPPELYFVITRVTGASVPTREVSPRYEGLSMSGGLPVISRSMKPDGIGRISDVRGVRRRRDSWGILCDQPRRAAVGDEAAGLTLLQPHLTSWRKGERQRVERCSWRARAHPGGVVLHAEAKLAATGEVSSETLGA